MRVLLDHDVPHELRSDFPEGCEVETAQYRGWSHFDDDELLTAAEEEFSALVTLDTNLVHQQNVRPRDIGVILIDVHPITPGHLRQYMDEVISVLPVAAESHRDIVIREDETTLLPTKGK